MVSHLHVPLPQYIDGMEVVGERDGDGDIVGGVVGGVGQLPPRSELPLVTDH